MTIKLLVPLVALAVLPLVPDRQADQKTPDSPIVRKAKPKKNNGEAGASCSYNNKTYKDGDSTCIAPYKYVCHDGQWVYTGTSCGGN
jgi:hypothetical protein